MQRDSRPSLLTAAAAVLPMFAGACSSPEPAAAPADAELTELGAYLHAQETRAPEPVRRVAHEGPEAVARKRAQGLDPGEVDFHASALSADYAVLDEAGVQVGLRRITRTEDRVYLDEDPGARDWYFVRNPVDPSRLTGFQIVHGAETILQYSESTLLDEGVTDSWSRVAQMGLSLRNLDALRPDGRSEQVYGSEFRCLVPEDPELVPGIEEVWWSDELQLPLRVAHEADGKRWTQLLLAAPGEPRESLLQDLAERFPDYAMMDVADYREELDVEEHASGGHDHGHAH